MLSEDPGVTYRLDGKALEAARDIHEYSKMVDEDYKQITLEIQKRSMELEQEMLKLVQEFEMKHAEPFTRLFERLGKALNLTVQEVKSFHLDATYIDSHNIAFLRQTPDKYTPSFGNYPGGSA